MLNIEISDQEISKCTCDKHALRMTLDRGSKSLKGVAYDLHISEGLLSRCLSTQYRESLRHDLVVPFMASCGNAIYLRWLFLRAKELMPALSERVRPSGDAEIIDATVLELRMMLREAIEEIKKAQPQHDCPECGAMFALKPVPGTLPKWLIREALWIDYEVGGSYE